MQEDIKILDVRFDIITLNEATEKVIDWIKKDKRRYATTPNPEILLEAQKNKEFLKVLNKSDLNIADGTGILWAAKYLKSTEKTKSKLLKTLKFITSVLSILFYPKGLKNPLPERVTGTDLMQKICERAPKEKIRIFLLGAGENVANIVKDILENKHPGIQIVGTHAGTPKEEDEKDIILKIKDTSPDILFVAYGAPNQELWISRNYKKIDSLKVAIGVGGAFDFIAKVRKRAPRWMQKIGLEWLYRLIQQPSRIKRIYNATIKFPTKVIKSTKKKSLFSL